MSVRNLAPVFAEARRIYVEHGKSVRAMSIATGIHRDTVVALLKRKNINYSPKTLDRLGFEYV